MASVRGSQRASQSTIGSRAVAITIAASSSAIGRASAQTTAPRPSADTRAIAPIVAMRQGAAGRGRARRRRFARGGRQGRGDAA